MSNLVKSYSVVREQDSKRIIDSNQAISDAIIRIKERMENEVNDSEDGFVQGLEVANVADLLYSEDDSEGERVLSGNIIRSEDDGEVSTKESEEALVGSKVKAAEEQAGFILANAKDDAQAIIDAANQKAEEIFANAQKEGYEAGYSEGEKIAQKQLEEKQAELEAVKTGLQEEYKEKCRRIEPDLIDTILKVFSDVTHVLSEDKKDLVTCLVRAVMDENVMSTSFVIRTSKEDAAFVKENKEALISDSSRITDILVVEDGTMKKGECMVETDFGIFDCSLDVQLEALIKDIKLLACAVGNE
ncbi:MAG: hypothetical protein E7266_08860 [Lachnospiraceae bacterium]|nr:hypothetical protein [Lachnospiraceae bacterium]